MNHPEKSTAAQLLPLALGTTVAIFALFSLLLIGTVMLAAGAWFALGVLGLCLTGFGVYAFLSVRNRHRGCASARS